MNRTKPIKKKKVTMDGLAAMVQRGFEDLLGEINNRFESVDKRLDTLEQKLEALS